MGVCVCVRARARVRACVRACVCVCVSGPECSLRLLIFQISQESTYNLGLQTNK